ncbi:MAG: PstS family phosphate ABC transporter substrate-binding protein [Bacteroidetes bacterium]|nr:MAG: PstS family phosphate ABC transporter substrate-binding protein [Bacteroidota bacterium]
MKKKVVYCITLYDNAMKHQNLWAVFLLLFVTGCTRPTSEVSTPLSEHQGAVRITGAYALYPLVSLWVTEYQKNHPEILFEIVARGSGSVWRDLDENRIDLAMVSSENLPISDSLLWVTPVARLGVVVVTSSANPYLTGIRSRGLTRGELAMAFTGPSGQSWGGLFGKPDSDPVHTYIRVDSAGATDQLARFLWQTPADFKGKGVDGEDAMLDAVMQDPLALGYCNFIYAFDPQTMQFRDGIAIIPLNPEQKGRGIDSFYDSVPWLQRAMWSGKYPSGLIRNLYLVSKEKPSTTEEVNFLQWILTDGQRLIAGAGYIEVPSREIRCRLESLSR